MTTVTWKQDTDGDWDQSVNWSGGSLPSEADDVVIGTLDPHTIQHSTGTDTISTSHVTNNTITVAGGLTQIAAGIGTDRVTFAIGRSSTVMVDGQAASSPAARP